MKILMFTTRFRPEVGGVEKVVESLALQLAKNHEVCVLTSMGKQGNLLSVSKTSESSSGYQVKRFWINYPATIMGCLAFPYRFINSSLQIINFVKKFKPDVINLHFTDSATFYVWILKFFVKTPLVVNIHGNDLHVFSHKNPYKYFIKSLLNSAKKVIVNSDYMKSEFETEYPQLRNKVEIISNGLNVTEIDKINPVSFITSPYIFYVGRLVSKKGVDLLTKAFAKSGISNLHLVIEGSGEEEGNLRKLIKDNNLDNLVHMTEGKLTENEKISYMKGALFGVMPSRIEPFGIVALEFLAAGTPLIASMTGGLKSILKDHKTTLFFENENVTYLSEKINEIYENGELRQTLSSNGKEEVRKYDWYNISKHYEALFKSL